MPFGGGYSDTAQSLSLQAALASAFEHITFPAAASETSDPLSETSHVARATLSYSVSRQRVGLNAAASFSAFYFGGFDESALVGQNGSLTGHYSVSSRTKNRSGTVDAARQPLSVDSYLPGFYGSGGVAPSDTLPEPCLACTSTCGLAQRSAINWHSDSRYRQPMSDARAIGKAIRAIVRHRSSGGRASGYRLSRVLGLRVGYGEGIGRFSSDVEGEDAPRSRSIDAGLEFEQALSLSRRTRLTFRSGSSGVSDNGQTRYWLTGAAAVTREIGRSWALSVGYDRKVDMQQTFRGATFSDSVVASFGGLIHRRLQFYSTASAAVGSVGLTRQGDVDNKFQAFQAQSGVTVALSQSFGLTCRPDSSAGTTSARTCRFPFRIRSRDSAFEQASIPLGAHLPSHEESQCCPVRAIVPRTWWRSHGGEPGSSSFPWRLPPLGRPSLRRACRTSTGQKR